MCVCIATRNLPRARAVCNNDANAHYFISLPRFVFFFFFVYVFTGGEKLRPPVGFRWDFTRAGLIGVTGYVHYYVIPNYHVPKTIL